MTTHLVGKPSRRGSAIKVTPKYRREVVRKAARRDGRHVCTPEEAAVIHFQPVSEFTRSRKEMEKSIQANAFFLRCALETMSKSKEALVELWGNEETQKTFMRLHDDFVTTARWLRDSAKLVDAAAIRLLISGSASVAETKA